MTKQLQNQSFLNAKVYAKWNTKAPGLMQLHQYGLAYINQLQLVSVSSCYEHLGLVKT